MKLKIVIKYVLLIFWMSLIFYFSNQNGDISSNASNGIVIRLINFLESVMGVTFSEGMISIMSVLIRKIAHFTLYFILGLLWMNVLKDYSINLEKKVIYAVLLCLIYACSDEIHQLFICDRSGKIFDVFIDMFGSLSSIFITYLFYKRKKTI